MGTGEVSARTGTALEASSSEIARMILTIVFFISQLLLRQMGL
jgi:hypothetical protein